MIVNLINQHADRFLQVGLHFLWQGTATAILAALTSRFLLSSPRHRSTLYLGSLAVLFLCVPITLLSLSNPPSAQLPGGPAPSPLPDATPTSTPVATVPVEVSQKEQLSLPLSFWVVGMYLLGLLSMLIRVAIGYRWSRRIRRDGQAVLDGIWPEALTHAVASMKLRSTPAMIWSKNVASPVVTGIFRPMIVLPLSLMCGLPREQAVAILSHELAHLRRFDHLIVIFQRLLEALFFFHPAVWFLSRCLDQEREKACDDLVVQAGHNRADYAEALVKIASTQQSTLTLAAAQNNQLKSRIFRILNKPQPAATVRVNSGGWLTIAAMIGSLGFLSLSPALSDENDIVEAEKSEEIETGSAAILKKLEIRIPEINLQNVTLVEAAKFLRTRSIELDPTADPNAKGINIVVRKLSENEAERNPTIDRLVERNLTFIEAFTMICQKTKTRFKVNDYAVTILPQLAPGEEDTWIVTRRWTTPPNFPALIAATGIGHRSKSVAGHLEALGVVFSEGSAASYLASSSTLVVRNTPKNLELVDQIVKASSDPKTAKEQRDRAKSTEAERLVSAAHDKLLRQRKWTTPPNFLYRISPHEGLQAISAVNGLKENGVNFLGNSSASYNRENNTLIVSNTVENLELVDALVKAAGDPDFSKKQKVATVAARKNALELENIIFPAAKFQHATLAGAVEFISIRALELDPTRKGVKIKFSGDKNLPEREITNLNLINVPLPVVLKYVCDITKTQYTVEGRNISISPQKQE